jgi:hypothetical protein
MRRKYRKGVLTNATVRYCYSDSFCNECKGVCKARYRDSAQEESVWHVFYENCGKLHKEGFGSLMPKKKFIPFVKSFHKLRRWDRNFNIKRKRSQNAKITHNVAEEIEYINYITQADHAIKKLRLCNVV